MKLRGIKDYDSANRFLDEVFWHWYNSRYPDGINLDLIFTVREKRKVNKDNTIKFKGQTYQLLPTNGLRRFAGKWVYVCGDQKAQIAVLCDGNKIAYNLFQEKGKILDNSSTVEETMSTTEKVEKKKKWKPAENHPWRGNFKLKKKNDNVTF